jgi:hypothetical protein
MGVELISQLRMRVQARYYDRPDVIEAIARSIASHMDAWG